MKEKIKSQNRLLPLIKIAGSLLALYVLYTQIDFSTTYRIILQTRLHWIVVALLLFNLSQGVSAIRLNHFFTLIGVPLSTGFNLKLYYIGMFYNLLLPGGIGGDAYKGFLLKKYFHAPVRRLASAMIADRASGLYAIFILMAILAILLSEDIPLPIIYTVGLAVIVGITGLILFHQLFPLFRKIFLKATILSLAIQGLQIAAVWAILQSLGISDNIPAYLLIFLLSSVATIIPITVGGLGLREMVFLYGARYFGLDPEISVSVSLLFFALTVLSSLAGLILHYFLTKEQWIEQASSSGAVDHLVPGYEE
ncbi:MAG: lysylphosphatidylglycerol synthase transmembrane domain-containing protein [Cyclobacteriaceae bacterium]